MVVIKNSCVNAKLLVQKQGEYTSGHFRRYCDIMEPAKLHRNFVCQNQSQNRLFIQFSILLWIYCRS
jgi:hypothetical protein